jgi:isopentenyldiphosphate isomerase
MSQDNLIQIVDENDQSTGSSTIEEAQKTGAWHRIIRVILEDGSGNMLLQKRSQNMTTYPGRWSDSTSGHVDVGESYETAAIRELAEELGLQNVKLTEVGYYKSQNADGWRELNRFNKIFKGQISRNQPLKLQKDEVEAIKWLSLIEVKRLIAERPDDFVDGFRETIKRFYS